MGDFSKRPLAGSPRAVRVEPGTKPTQDASDLAYQELTWYGGELSYHIPTDIDIVKQIQNNVTDANRETTKFTTFALLWLEPAEFWG